MSIQFHTPGNAINAAVDFLHDINKDCNLCCALVVLIKPRIQFGLNLLPKALGPPSVSDAAGALSIGCPNYQNHESYSPAGSYLDDLGAKARGHAKVVEAHL